MTIDQRIEKLEFVVAGIEQAAKDYAENRQLWREAQEDDKQMRDGINRLRMETLDLRADTERYVRRLHAEADQRDNRIEKLVSSIGAWISDAHQRDQQAAARLAALDERIEKLMSAIGTLVQKPIAGAQ